MAQAYLIGGAPRVGKTTLLHRFLQAYPILSLSTDELRYVLRRITTVSDQPDLFNASKFLGHDPEAILELTEHPDLVIKKQVKESAVVWKSVVNYIESALSGGRDVVVEGIAVLPEFVRQLELPYTCVILGSSSIQHAQSIYNVARQDEYDWLHGVEDETIKAFSTFSLAFGHYIEAEAKRYDLPYVEVNDASYDASISSALSLLKENHAD